MKTPLSTLAMLVAAGAGLMIVPNVFSDDETCNSLLYLNQFDCTAVTDQGEDIHLELDFFGSTGPEAFGVAIESLGGSASGPHYGACACNAKKAKPSDPDKVGFLSHKKTFTCTVGESGPDATGTDGPFTFALDGAAYQAKASKKGLKKGQAVDESGNQLVFECDVVLTGDA